MRQKPRNLDPGDFFYSTRTESGGATLTRQTFQFITNAILPPFAFAIPGTFFISLYLSRFSSRKLLCFFELSRRVGSIHTERQAERSQDENGCCFFPTGWIRDGRCDLCYPRIRKSAMWFQFATVQTIT